METLLSVSISKHVTLGERVVVRADETTLLDGLRAGTESAYEVFN